MYSDFSFCQAAKYRTQDGDATLPKLLIYDIGCGWCRNFLRRVTESDTLCFNEMAELIVAVGKWHLSSHIQDCYHKFSLNFIKGAGHWDGEIMETVWSQLNPAAITACSMTISHRQETLNQYMRDMNFKKMISMGIKPCSNFHF